MNSEEKTLFYEIYEEVYGDIYQPVNKNDIIHRILMRDQRLHEKDLETEDVFDEITKINNNLNELEKKGYIEIKKNKIYMKSSKKNEEYTNRYLSYNDKCYDIINFYSKSKEIDESMSLLLENNMKLNNKSLQGFQNLNNFFEKTNDEDDWSDMTSTIINNTSTNNIEENKSNEFKESKEVIKDLIENIKKMKEDILNKYKRKRDSDEIQNDIQYTINVQRVLQRYNLRPEELNKDEENDIIFIVKSDSDKKKRYRVNVSKETCQCPFFIYKNKNISDDEKRMCKHLNKFGVH